MLKKTETMEPRKPVQNLTETINSLLGVKSHLTSGWVKSVCDIIRNLRSERPSIDLKSAIQRKSDSFEKKDDDLGSKISKIKDELAALTANINQLNIQRRQVLNDFLDLKGNIRVFCRIRPIGVGESFGHFRPVVPLESSKVLLRISDNKSKSYSFDKVFQPGSSQDEVFSEVEPVIKSAMDGYNACIFAYGQTGTGKTFTMEGTPEFPGVVPRALEALFKQAADSNHAFLFTFSMLEIYMGNLKDLLITQPRKAIDSMPPCLSIQTDSKGGIEIENLVGIQVSEFNQALRLYRLGCQSRSTASTDSNTKSSRSHSLIRLSITCFNAPERQRETNKVWLVDLGGSERVLKTKAWGRRFEEGKAINLSLSALGDVINALQRKKFHVPYRNSKLTRVLKDSLGDGSKVLMLVHVSPKEEDLCETICSLNFATRARSIDLGTVDSTGKRNEKEVVMTSLQQKMKMIEEERQNVKRNIDILNEKLETITSTGPNSSQQLDAPHLSIQLPQPDHEVLRNNTRDVTAGNMSQLPRFMRPTICSRRKAGVAQKNSEEKHLFSARRRRPASHRAESVTFPIKGNSDYSSECSISRSSCLLGLNMKGSADIEAEYSQDTSECDIKAVVFPEQEKSPRCSLNQNDPLGCSEGYGNSLQNNWSTTEFMKVDKWLHLHKNEQYISCYSQRSKRILPIPASEKKYGLNGQKKDDCPRDGKVDNSNFEMKEIFNHEKLEKKVDAEAIRRSIQEEAIDKPQTRMEDCFSKDPRSGSNCLLHMIDGDLLTKKTDLVHCPLIVDNECGNSFSTSICGCSFHSGHYDNSINLMSMVQAVKGETRYPDSFLPENIGCSHILPSDSHYSVVNSKEDSNISFSLLAMESECPVPAEIGMEYSKKENFYNSSRSSIKEARPGLQKLGSRIALYMVNPNPEELTMPCVKSQEYAQTAGTCHLLKQKIQIVYASVLIGLGFQDLGFKHEFFYGLML